MNPPTAGPSPAQPTFASPVAAGPVPPGVHPAEPPHRAERPPLTGPQPAPPAHAAPATTGAYSAPAAPTTHRAPAAPATSTTPTPSPATLLKPRSRHGDPAARRVARALRRLTGGSVAREVERAARIAETLQQPVTTGRQIAVTGIRGGAGKTTVTALLGLSYAHFRQDPVLMLEADAALGTLPTRLGAPGVRWTCGDLAQIITPSMQLTDVTGYLVQLPGRGWLLPGSQGRVGARLELAEYRAVMLALRRYFGITVVDCDSLPSELSRTALVAAQARVLVTPATAEGVMATRAVLDWMATLRRGGLLRRTVVVVTEVTPHTAVDLDAAREVLRLDGVSVRALPYDRHLAAGGAVRTELLARRTHDEVTELAADVLTRSLEREGRLS
ncbi:hypothetical protein ABT104_25900 [Streptomyces mobaraensis]|uniref:hypothetical protein n=1 Tax=Streptomyces mobaraensis TaxID=35621 RepID=UPI003316DB7F